MPVPDYYSALDIAPSATPADIRQAYKRAALSTHPDRFPPNSSDWKTATTRFQQVNDAYYTLSDPARRREYDRIRQKRGTFRPPSANADEQFGDVFEEMMSEDVPADQKGNVWGILGGISGGVMGFILANVAGAVAGAVAGNRLGAIRDTKGKPVYHVFQELPRDEKARVLAGLAQRVFAQMGGAGGFGFK